MRRPGVAERAGARGHQRSGARDDDPVSPHVLTALAWAVGLVATSAILGTPYLLFGYRNAELHLVLDTVDACVAFLLAYLIHGRFIRSRRVQDLFLAQGLFLLGLAGLGLSLTLTHLEGLRPLTVDVWLPMTLRMVGSLLIVAAAVAGGRTAPAAWERPARLVPWLLLVGATTVMLILRDHLPVAVEQPPASAARPALDGHPALLTGQAVSAACFLVASVWFTRQAAHRPDALVRWLGPACALGGFARIHYVLFPSIYSDWVYTGDLLRIGCYALLLVGAAREIGQYWSARARAAVLEDRRRLARELHDGVVQELGYIRSESFGIPDDGGLRERVQAACDRALDEARAAVEALGRAGDEPLGFALHRAARHVAERYGGSVAVDLDDSVDADPEQRHALVRIIREAVSNAMRHGGADTARIRLERAGANRRLVIEDDGIGFDVSDAESGTGYGLVSMRERAVRLPGSFNLTSVRGRGTTVEVTW